MRLNRVKSNGVYPLRLASIAILAFMLVLGSCSKKTAAPTAAPPTPAPVKGKSALIIVDMQNDYCSGGAFEVAGADEIIPIINQLQEKYDVVVASQDWHPADHSIFSDNNPGGAKPPHCVQDTPGAELAAALNSDGIKRVFQKGKNPEFVGYSAFFEGDFFTATGMGPFLQSQNVTDIAICGVATEACVKNTAIDGLQNLKFNTTFISDASRGRNDEAMEKAIGVLTRAGVEIVESSAVLAN